MTTLRFKVEPGRIKWGDLWAFEAEKPKQRDIAAVMARHLVSETGARLPLAEAMKLMGELDLNEVNDLARQFTEAVTELRNSASPPASGGSSDAPSALGTLPPP
jgi:hypothetical protein